MPSGHKTTTAIRSNDPLAGGGEMGALMRTIDWAQTPLGPVEQWPTSLRTMVGVVLGNRFPTLIFWSRDFIQLYNDGYRPILGDKHPRSMGGRGAETWAEIWDILGPMAAGILDGQPATWSEHLLLPMNRRGYIEEAYFTFSYSPIPDDDGTVGGVLVTVQETTAEVLDARQLRSLRELGAWSTAEARSAVQACETAVHLLGVNDADVPFAMIYLLDEAGARAELAGATGFSGYEGTACPAVIELSPGPDAEPAPWPLAEAARTGAPVVVDNVAARFGPLPQGRWPNPPRAGLVVPLARAGQQTPYGFLVAGVSPRRAFDESYLGFFRLAADQIAAAIASARAHEEARRRSEALAALDRAKTAFFSNVSHEFRTPLTLMLGPLEDALTGPEALAGARLEMVHRNALRLLKLVNTLLDFSRIEAGRFQASFAPVDIGQFTAELASVFRSAVERAGLRLTIEAPAGTTIHVDRDLWEMVVLNLLSNALKFTFQGEIHLVTRPTAEGVEIEVADTGVGIAAQHLPRLFERFHRVEGGRARTHEGSGIGLAMVQEIVRLHGGDIQVSSVVGKGTRFTIHLRRGTAHLPPERVAADDRGPWASRQSAAFVEEALRWMIPDAPERTAALDQPLATVRPGSHILVADDNGDMRDYVSRILRQQGWEVTAVADGQAALDVLGQREVHLVLSDVMMPIVDGLALLRAIRQDRALAATPIILLSARAGQESRVDALDAGADDYLVKPFAARELVARIGSQLSLAALRQERARERAVLEERASLAQREAELQKAHLAWLFTQMPMPIVILRGENFVVELCNPAICKVWRRREEDVVGKPLVEALPELRGQPYIPRLQDVFRTGQTYVGKEATARFDPGDHGPPAYYNYAYVPLKGVHAQVERILIVANEVTEQVEARHSLEQLRGEAESANRAKDEFLAMLGHELRNPLSPILTALQLLRLRGDSTREHQVIERQVTHLVRLVDDLLDVARITQGKIELRKKRVEVAAVVLRAVEMATPLLERRQQRLSLDVPPEGLLVLGDPARLAQVVSNLLTNASKYSDPGTAVSVVAAAAGDQVNIRVRDQGIGIAPEMLDHIFEAFVQQRQAIDRSGGGLGLGLSIVRSLVAMHDGRVSATSRGPGAGSEFTVQLPLVEAMAADAQAVRPGQVAGAAQHTSRILIVDDNDDAAAMIGELLGSMGFDVRIAHDGPSALALAAGFRPHVALLDIGLPVMDGYELGKRLREVLPSTELRLVAVTGYGQDNDRKRSREAGFAAHIVKPVDIDVLTRVLLN
jgi:signal transduction histidine kinase/DNA-binding response OmpR family regulator